MEIYPEVWQETDTGLLKTATSASKTVFLGPKDHSGNMVRCTYDVWMSPLEGNPFGVSLEGNQKDITCWEGRLF